MRDVQLPNGEWVTTAISAGTDAVSQSQCPDDTCTWVDFGSPTPPGLLPEQMQLQKCDRCHYVRGRYLSPPALKPVKPILKLKVGNREFSTEDLYVIAVPLRDYPSKQDVTGSVLTCSHCLDLVVVDSDSLKLIDHGATVVCLPCALAHCGKILAGHDPDTGRTLTLQDVIGRPYLNGAYRYDDIQRF